MSKSARELYFWLVIGIALPILGRTILRYLRKLIWKKIQILSVEVTFCQECFKPSQPQYVKVEDRIELKKQCCPDTVSIDWILEDNVSPTRLNLDRIN